MIQCFQQQCYFSFTLHTFSWDLSVYKWNCLSVRTWLLSSKSEKLQFRLFGSFCFSLGTPKKKNCHYQRKEGLCKVRALSGAVADAESTGRAGEEGEGGGGRVGGRGRGRCHPVQQELPLPRRFYLLSLLQQWRLLVVFAAIQMQRSMRII